MSSAREQVRAVIEQMYSAVGLSRSLNVPPIDADGLFAWAVTLDACFTLLEPVVHAEDCDLDEDCTCGAQLKADGDRTYAVVVQRDGWDCAWCGHRHAGRQLAYICIGCRCEHRPQKPQPSNSTNTLPTS